MIQIQIGEILKEAGRSRVEMNNQEFVDEMRRHARKLAIENGRVTCDQLRRFADEHLIFPKHQNAWGAIFRGKHWRMTGRTQSKIASNHARWIAVWEWTEE